jgi:hypothetical protein
MKTDRRATVNRDNGAAGGNRVFLFARRLGGVISTPTPALSSSLARSRNPRCLENSEPAL